MQNYVVRIHKVKLKIRNPTDPKKSIQGDFLVDSGASFTVLPQKLVKQLALKPSFTQEFVLADGTVIERPIGNALIEFQGRETASPVVLGEKEDTQLLGVLTLEGLGLTLDPFQRKLFPARLMM